MAVENIKAMSIEIARMKEWCLENYDKGADTMIECWTTEHYEDLFYEENPNPALRETLPRVRCTFAEAWDLLRSLASIYADRQADAHNSAF